MQAFLAEIDTGDILHNAIPVVAVAMSLTIPIVAIIVDHFQKKAKMRLIETAIEHGVDPAELNLDFESKSGPYLPYRAGMVTLAVGVALLVAAKVALTMYGIFYVLANIGGAVCVLVGLALIINDWMNRDRIRAANELRDRES